MAVHPYLDASAPWPHHTSTKDYPYSPSLASAASSSSSSVFSLDAPSSQSSVPSSAGWSSSTWNSENESDQYFTSRYTSQKDTASSPDEEVVINSYLPSRSRPQSCAEAVAPESRQHPRRTQRLNSYESQDGKIPSLCPRPPPSLVRQSERKENFVDSLVGKLTLDTLGRTHMLTISLLQRHRDSDDRDHMAPVRLILRPGHDPWRQATELDRSSGFRARSVEAIKDQLLYITGGSLLFDPHPVLHTKA